MNKLDKTDRRLTNDEPIDEKSIAHHTYIKVSNRQAKAALAALKQLGLTFEEIDPIKEFDLNELKMVDNAQVAMGLYIIFSAVAIAVLLLLVCFKG